MHEKSEREPRGTRLGGCTMHDGATWMDIRRSLSVRVLCRKTSLITEADDGVRSA
ncbi:hypothetical protein DICSQDRAFT_136936 [Dichomitus squalens LYAD-421 SS1]|uniref:Uncharacterized protein n=1 Tax=Dichomitus squalens (strain LYAD-421) TaxID=732165 RepID=R7T1C0_DICSQ|nr:uncharacterized protein DICSQDRAFT_136936 [Dichomitus squalens LYAD-421 SS1]EJF60977.1 hypothetical protein DICSQDRAFT_136936 [Dichomitus squalens LYAD-421 SS1]